MPRCTLGVTATSKVVSGRLMSSYDAPDAAQCGNAEEARQRPRHLLTMERRSPVSGG